MTLPEPVKYLPIEGGYWEEWNNRKEHNSPNGIRFHAILFDDGRVFDMFNGWRKQKSCVHCGAIQQ